MFTTAGRGAECGIIEKVPTVKFVKVPPAQVDFLDADEYERLLSAAAEEPSVQVAIRVAGDAGLRAGEVRALKWSRIDFTTRNLTVAETFWGAGIWAPPRAAVSVSCP